MDREPEPTRTGAAAPHAHGHSALEYAEVALRRDAVREGFTMALYIAISLLAVMLALPPSVGPEASGAPALVIFLTAIGLLAAHVAAFRLSTRLVHRGRLPAEQARLVGAQLLGGLSVALLAVVPVLIFGGAAGVIISELLLIGLVAFVGYETARAIPVSRTRALLYALVVVGVALVILWIKGLVH
jgi:hypothetical protein